MTATNDEHAAQRKAEAIAARRARRPAWRKAHADRINREREARATSREYRRAQSEANRGAGKPCRLCKQTLPLSAFGFGSSRCKPCLAAAARGRYQRKRARSQRNGTTSERIAHLTSLLMGTNPDERISTDEGWNMTQAELDRLWLTSGDKECVSCKAVVPPSALPPPGPANFYPGHCRPCAHAEYRRHSLRVFGTYPEGAPLIPMLDGTSITVAELARRHRNRPSA